MKLCLNVHHRLERLLKINQVTIVRVDYHALSLSQAPSPAMFQV